ncbi:MAG TPA: glycosyl hydrolase family 65 protein [Terriglobales bacterium]|nr:glycosyl hydrolase family 65 protein [Terriglobales bacterium]
MQQPKSFPSMRDHGEFLSSPQEIETQVGRAIVATGSDILAIARRSRQPGWLLLEEGFALAREHEVESLFAIANGYVGNRGSLAEGTALSAPATFAAGVFEASSKPGTVPGLFVLPDWTEVRALIEGQELNMSQGQVLEHRRILDMHHGVLWREWRHRDVNGRITRVTAFRLASLSDRHLLVQSILFAPENYSGNLRLETSIELPPEVQASPPPEDWKTRRNATRPNVLPLALRSPGRDITVAFGAASQLVTSGHDTGRREIEIGERRITEAFEVDVEIAAEYRLDRVVSIYTSRESEQPIEAAVSHVNTVMSNGLDRAVASHINEWEARWRDADIVVDGDEPVQCALRFAGYHLISAANPEDQRVSIGARALTGESYKGHVFWDTEIYMVPFYSFTHPPSARALLMYRYHTLPAAREKARAAGYRGAMYPWESADTGEETTPNYVIGPGGEVIRVLNGEMELHITSDIAYAIWQYWKVTGDDEFFVSGGAEIMLETARFWASRGQVEADGRYHIRNVIGPDEYHENVDDNAFTNNMAAWNMRRGAEAADILTRRWPERWRELSSRLNLSVEEIAAWTHLADIIYTGFESKSLLFEQFAGYYGKEHIDLLSYEPRTTAMDVILGHDRIQQTNVVKQADVVMLIFLLWNDFPAPVREANFRYYEPRTGHGSSLSPSIHAAVSARLGDLAMAEKYLRQSAEIDLGNNMGNAAGGVHAAAIGGLWQAMVLGFAGMELTQEGLRFNPHLLPQWKRLAFPVQWRGRKIKVSIDPQSVTVECQGNEGLSIGMVDGPEIHVPPGHRCVTGRLGQTWQPWRAD